MDRGALWIVLAVFLITLFLGLILIDRLPYGYTECALVYLAAVVAASAAWITPIRLYSAKEDFDYEFGTYHCP